MTLVGWVEVVVNGVAWMMKSCSSLPAVVVDLPAWEEKMVVVEASVVEAPVVATAEWVDCSFLPLGVLTIGSNVGACRDASVAGTIGLVMVVIEVPMDGAHVAGDDSGLEALSRLQLVLMMHLVPHDHATASGCCSSALGLGETLIAGLHHVGRVLHGEGRKTYCRWGETVHRPQKYGGMEPMNPAEYLRG